MLLLSHLGLTLHPIKDCSELLMALGLPTRKRLHALRALSEAGKLVERGLIVYEDANEELLERKPMVDSLLIDAVLLGHRHVGNAWAVNTEVELYDQLQNLTHALSRKSDFMKHAAEGCVWGNELCKWIRSVDREMARLKTTLELRPDWKLNRLFRDQNDRQRIMLLALLGKELGHPDADEDLCSGGGLARAASRASRDVRSSLRLLAVDRNLVCEGLVRPCGGLAEQMSGNPSELERAEFEITEKTVGILGLEKSMRQKKRPSELTAQAATVRMEQLVFPDHVQKALSMALAHVRHSQKIIGDWGLGEVIPYGRSPVLLFSGPPGTGKTAAAIALAHELDRPILVADYSRIQNCFVGQTEKNIVRVFREAKNQKAVLLWDEADAMFFDRDSAQRNWEVRDVNVLLQEVERSESVCILATNRKITLDKALQRRIALKVEFDRPDQKRRRLIWERLLPEANAQVP